MKRSEKKSDEKRLRVLRPGESLLLGHTVRDLELVLYRPIQRSDSVQVPQPTEAAGGPASPVSVSPEVGSSDPEERPLFFDTTACFFLDGTGKVDYVTPGHAGISTQGATYLSHAVVTGLETNTHHTLLLSAPVTATEETADSTWTANSPLSAPSYATKQNGGPTMAPGDGVLLSFNDLNPCTGALVCATLFTPGVLLSQVTNAYFVARRPKSSTPLAFVPITTSSEACNSCIALMLRHVRVKGEVCWELVSVAEGTDQIDVKGVLRSLQARGLRDPNGYSGGAMLATDDSSDSSDCDVITEELSSIQNDQALDETPSHSAPDSEIARAVPKPVEQTITHAPRLVRRGRHQYNVGRSAARADSTTEEDEAMDDVLRAVVPQFAANEIVRYESGAYNVGSTPTTLAAHYTQYREHYAVEAADGGKPDSVPGRKNTAAIQMLPAAVLENRRDSDSEGHESILCRPELPFELLSPSAQAAVIGAQQGRDGASPRQRASRSRSHSRSSSKKKKKNKKKTPTQQQKSGSAAPRGASEGKRPRSGRRRPSSKRSTSSTKRHSSPKTHVPKKRNEASI